MNLIFIGVQGSGKGTQAKIISRKLNIKHISTGDLLRNIKGRLKEKVDRYMNSGQLIPDELMIEILLENINEKGFILDGFPRNLKQAKQLDSKIKIDKVIEIHISDEEAIKRLSGRLLCPKCGAGYNSITSPKPKKEGICDNCQGKLVQRKDDTKEAIKKRIETYHKETEPIIEHYKNKLIRIDGEKTIEKISTRLLQELHEALD